MASIDHERKQISAAILLYGPPGAGKTTSLYSLARQLPPGSHGKVAPLPQSDGRLLKLDYRPHDQDMVYGYQVSFRLVTCPGQIEVDLVKPLVGAIDSVLFVADSSRQAQASNAKALELLDRLMRSAGRTLDQLPMLFLYNKRDLREAVEIRSMEQALNRFGCSYIAASAVRGQGVVDALQRLTASVALQVRQQVQASGAGGATGNVRTVAHGQNYEQARAMHSMGPSGATPGPARGGPDWGGDADDRTEVNREPEAWTGGAPAHPEPAEDGRWRTPDAFAEDVDADDRTMPFADVGVPPDSDADPDDVTMAQLGPSAGAPGGGGRIRTRLQPVGGGEPVAPAPPPPRRAPAPPPQPPPVARSRPGAVPPPARSLAPEPAASRTRRVLRAPAPLPPPQLTPTGPSAPARRAPMPPPPPGGGQDPFTATQVINSLQRPAEGWEGQVAETANVMKVPVPELQGYVISRLGTPKASSRRTIEIPVRATHMDTLMPQDLVLHVQFSGGMRSGPPPTPKSVTGGSVPKSWFIASIVVAAIAVVALVAFYALNFA